MRPILLEIVTRVMTSYDPCHRCTILFDEAGLQRALTQKTMGDYPQDLREESINLSNWIRELTRLYKHRLRIRLIDAQSLLGMYKCLRHWIRSYPAFIVEGKEKFVGWDKDRLEGLLDDYIQSSIQSRKRRFQSIFP